VIVIGLFLPLFGLAKDTKRPEGWTDESHGRVNPNYEIVFTKDKVRTLTLSLSADTYAAMQENMLELYGEPRQNAGGRLGGPPLPPAVGDRPANPNPNQARPPRAGGLEGVGAPLVAGGVTENPSWFEADLGFEGLTWKHVGFRV